MTDETTGTMRLHVVKVLNARELVISGGTEGGVSEGDVVRVVAPAMSLKDPISGEDLGQLATTKAVLRVYQAAQKYALARTFRTKRVNVGGAGGQSLGNIFNPPKYETRTETLVRDRSLDVSGEFAIEVGDLVELWDDPVGDVPSVTTWA